MFKQLCVNTRGLIVSAGKYNESKFDNFARKCYANIKRQTTNSPSKRVGMKNTSYAPHTFNTKIRQQQILYDAKVPADLSPKVRRKLVNQLRQHQWIQYAKETKGSLSHRKIMKQTDVDEKLMSYIKRIHAGKQTKNKKIVKEMIEKRRGVPIYIDLIFEKDKLKPVASAKSVAKFPPPFVTNDDIKGFLPEIAFAGRSNVGKSTLLNTLVGSKGKAAVSDKPGMTQTINFYRLSDYFCMVDLPGYGFAYADENVIDNWNNLIRWYLTNRTKSVLKRVFVLIDARHGIKDPDREFLTFLNQNKVKNQVILTKSDLVFPEDLARRIKIMNEQIQLLRSTVPDILLASGRSKSGIAEIQKVICTLIDPEKLHKIKKKAESVAKKKEQFLPLL